MKLHPLGFALIKSPDEHGSYDYTFRPRSRHKELWSMGIVWHVMRKYLHDDTITIKNPTSDSSEWPRVPANWVRILSPLEMLAREA